MRKQRSHKKKRIWLRILGIIFLVVLAFLIWIVIKLDNTSDTIYEPTDANSITNIRDEKASISNGDPISILLLGIDHNSGRTEQNSDVMILVTINPDTDEAKMVSIPRDTPIPGTEEKINSAYVTGGAAGAMNAVQTLLNVPVDYYATVDMEGLTSVIDTLGGVTLNNNLNFEQNGYTFNEGTINIQSGDEALAYIRNRYDDPNGDFGRNERQRKLLLAILDKFSSPAIVTQVGDLFESVENYVTTNLTTKDMTQLAINYRVNSDEVDTNLSLVGETGTGSNGASLNYVSDSQIDEVSSALRQNLNLE